MKEVIFMIRTDVVNLTVIPAVAFRQKLTSGGSGITILAKGIKQPGIASISKTSGEAIPMANAPAAIPIEAFNEAITLTTGMPYNKRGSVRPSEVSFKEYAPADIPEAADDDPEDEALIDSSEYQKIVDAYTDAKGKFSYDLLNKDLITFANSSKVVKAMVDEMEAVETIRNYIITKRFGNITDNADFSEAKAIKLAELLDEIDPKGIFKDLNGELRKKLAASKKN